MPLCTSNLLWCLFKRVRPFLFSFVKCLISGKHHPIPCHVTVIQFLTKATRDCSRPFMSGSYHSIFDEHIRWIWSIISIGVRMSLCFIKTLVTRQVSPRPIFNGNTIRTSFLAFLLCNSLCDPVAIVKTANVRSILGPNYWWLKSKKNQKEKR